MKKRKPQLGPDGLDDEQRSVYNTWVLSQKKGAPTAVSDWEKARIKAGVVKETSGAEYHFTPQGVVFIEK